MKKLVKEYTFDPPLNKIHFSDTFLKKNSVSTESFLLVTNLTTGDMIYVFNEAELGGVFQYNSLTLDYDTTSMAATDKLQIFVDVAPAMHIRGDDGTNLGGSPQAAAYVSIEDLYGTFRGMYRELRKINTHLEIITDESIQNADLNGE